MSWPKRYYYLICFALWNSLNKFALAHAHEHHHDAIPEGEAVSPDPLDSILWWHITSMTLAFGIIFPIGMVLGVAHSRWHIPNQVLGSIIAIMGWFLGHGHKGRQFAPNSHASFAPYLMLLVMIQIAVGIYLKLHWETGIHKRIRRIIVVLHGVIGKAMPIASWVQMLLGGITALGFCREDHLGQCLAHFIMGSSFIAYGIIMVMMLLVGQAWLKRSGKSQEFWDSLVISSWGCINTFTEHRWGQEWSHGDYQHTSMGIVWWCAGLLGIWLSRGTGGTPRRNVIPGLVIFLTGYAMSSHSQHLPVSTVIHGAFGYTLMAAGLARIIEICFVLRDKPELKEPSSFQHLPPFLLFASGCIFLAATEEQLALVDSMGVDHVSYILVLYSLAFFLYLFTQFLVYLFITQSTTPKSALASEALVFGESREVNEFELEGLIGDDESEPESKRQ